MYKFLISDFFQVSMLIRISDNVTIPQNPNNVDYREYLAWVALGNTAPIEHIIINPMDTRIAARIAGSKVAVKAIPDWALWTQAQVLAWIQTNIGDPLAVPIPAAPMSAAQIRQGFVNIVAVLNTIRLMLIAMSKLLIALRDKNYPEIPEE